MANMENGSGSGLNIDKIIGFCKKNVKYISGGVLLVALVIVLAVMGVNNSGGKDKPEQKVATEEEQQNKDEVENNSNDNQDKTEDANTEKEEHPEIKQLVSTYYNSYATGDLEHLSSVAKKLSDMEKDYIRMMNEHVESYADISCTVADGVKEGSYVVAAVYQMKFAGADETLPGMNVFYIQTDKDGKLYINNLYSSFNRELKEQKTKKKVIKLIEEFEKSADVQKLQNEVQTEYDKKVAENEDLQKKLNEMVDAIANWKETYTPPEDNEEEPEQKPEESEEPAATDDGNADDGSDNGNADDGNADNSSDDGNADDGNADNSSDDGNADDSSDDGGNSSGLNYVPEGTVLTANDGYNVRKSMDETSELVGTTAVGDSIKIILSYAEGWTKVEWNGTTGYIRTDLLLNN
jgi:hypothetical protein